MPFKDNTRLWPESFRKLADFQDLPLSRPGIENCKSTIEMFSTACQWYSERPALVFRNSKHAWETITFRELWRKTQELASEWMGSEAVKPGDRVAILTRHSIEAVIADFACLYSGTTSVHVCHDWAPQFLEEILDHLKPAVVFERHSSRKAKTIHPHFQYSPAENPLRTVCFTSGSSGNPKSVPFSEKVWLEVWKSSAAMAPPLFPVVNAIFTPLSQIFARQQILQSICAGGVSYLLSVQAKSLLDEICHIEPTSLHIVPEFAKSLLETKTHHPMGKRVLYLSIGAAPVVQALKERLREKLRVPVIEGFGSTEAGPMFIDHKLAKEVLDWRLEGVPELGYFPEDKPHPRGEICVKTRRTILQTELDQCGVDRDGFWHSGDIVEKRGDRFIWLGRKNGLIKLPNGKFVGLGGLEARLGEASRLIDQIYLWSDGYSPLLAVIVPRKRVEKAVIKNELRTLLRKGKLKSHEIPFDFVLEFKRFTTINHLLTPSGKLCRPNLSEKYRSRLESLLKKSKSRQNLSEPDLLLQKELGASSRDLARFCFSDLGGDSLKAMELAIKLESLGVSLSAPDLLSPLPVTKVLQQTRNSPAIITRDLKLTQFLPENVFTEAKQIFPWDVSKSGSIFLTGATGFLGRFLCLELLKRLNPQEKLYCLVRGENAEVAARRLRAVFASDENLLRAFDRHAKRLVVLPGDLSKPHLGLRESRWRDISKDVREIFHAGAVVNHLLPYQDLFHTNVSGTAEIIRLALSIRPKAIHYISSESAKNDSGGYGSSKWGAEELLTDLAGEFDLPVDIFRSPYVFPHKRFRGQINRQDTFTRALQGVLHSGIVPRGDTPLFSGAPVEEIVEYFLFKTSVLRSGIRIHKMPEKRKEDFSWDRIYWGVRSAGFDVRQSKVTRKKYSTKFLRKYLGDMRHQGLC